jgi:hypothetical protein
VVGLLMVWFFAGLRLHYDEGAMGALKSGLALWTVFWFIPMMSITPMNLFQTIGLLYWDWMMTAEVTRLT